MLVDARQLDEDAALEADVCVVGGGVAGIVLGLELERAGIRCCLIEAGGESISRRSQSLYDGEAWDGRYSLTGTRTRCLGGSSNCWGGWARPLGPIDLAVRPWLDGLSWPIAMDALESHFPRASELLQVGPPESDSVISRSLGDDAPARIDPETTGLETMFFAMSPPTKFGRAYRAEMAAARHLTVVLHATTTEVLTDDTGARATGVSGRSERGAFTVTAPVVVLAAGGIENPRLMLASRRVQAAGIGNGRDLVGRYFMDHPRLRTGRVRLTDPDRFSRLYDARHYSGGSLMIRRARMSAAMSPTRAVQERDGVLQSYTGLLACYAGQSHSVISEAVQIYKAMTGQLHERIDAGMIARSLRILPGAAAYLGARKLGLRGNGLTFEMETVLEPWPDRDNRVELLDATDRFGVPRVKVTWRRHEIERRTHRHAVEMLRAAFEAGGHGSVEIDPALGDDDVWERQVMTTWHHMGTTRMAAHPGAGVVDADCRVFGTDNLYVAGSSVFPTGGGSPPTFMIVALALRLADHLRRRTATAADTPASIPGDAPGDAPEHASEDTQEHAAAARPARVASV